MGIPAGTLPPELANDVTVVTRKAGLTLWHARLLSALERIAAYYDGLPPIKGGQRKGD